MSMGHANASKDGQEKVVIKVVIIIFNYMDVPSEVSWKKHRGPSKSHSRSMNIKIKLSSGLTRVNVFLLQPNPWPYPSPPTLHFTAISMRRPKDESSIH